ISDAFGVFPSFSGFCSSLPASRRSLRRLKEYLTGVIVYSGHTGTGRVVWFNFCLSLMSAETNVWAFEIPSRRQYDTLRQRAGGGGISGPFALLCSARSGDAAGRAEQLHHRQ